MRFLNSSSGLFSTTFSFFQKYMTVKNAPTIRTSKKARSNPFCSIFMGIGFHKGAGQLKTKSKTTIISQFFIPFEENN